MDYGPMLDVYKELFLKYSGGKPIDLPPDEFLVMAARMEAYLRGKGQAVEVTVGGDALWLSAEPSEIGVGVRAERYYPQQSSMLWTWFKPDPFKQHEQECVWTGEWSRWIGEIIGYKSQIEIHSGNLTEFNPEETVEKLLHISAKFVGSFPKIKVALDKLEASREELYANAKAELANILA